MICDGLEIMNRLILHILLGIWLFGATACTNDVLLDESGTVVPEGSGRVTAQLKFRPLAPALDTRTAGTAIKSIRSLCVLFYDEQGKLVEKRPVTDYDLDEEENRDSTTESKTPCATFSLTVPYGRYYIYVVANMEDLADYGEELRTVEGLKNISFDWRQDEVAANNQMFGHFTERGKTSDEAPLLTIARKETSLHAWLRRATSKVTVAFDGSRLEEGIFIYLKSVQIRDIPKSCLLGADNTPDDLAQLIADGETITYVEGTNYDETWPARITKGRPYYPYDEAKGTMSADAHAEATQALFFYENMQGEGEDKRQDWKNPGEITYPDGNDPTQPGYKDNQPYGTYIEVKAYYRSIHEDCVGSGDIVYRFMMGKDVRRDYDAERNYHYKLTLHFNRFANDVDWHIDYSEVVPSIQVPPFFISYLYNHSMMLPLKINAGPYKVTRLTARIDSNAWAPYEAYGTLDYYWQRDPAVNKNATEAPNSPWNGFLSLRKTKQAVIEPGFTGDVRLCDAMNRKYYEEHQRGERTYEMSDGWHTDAVDGDYYVESSEEDGEHSVTCRLPMYTRAKQLIIKSGYTGNNPYVGYRRKAVVTFTATLEGNGEKFDIEKSTPVLQVRRVVNPTGIWRKHDSTKPFHVVLKHLPSESATVFQTFSSEGAWRAYVVRGDRNFVTLDGGEEASGSTGSPVDFTIGFRGTCKADESRCAIVRVEYHNYSCYHLIFVRQGKAPMALYEGGTRWHACNMRTGTEEADCPVEEGSLFKFGNWDQPIDATSNVNDRTPWTSVTPGDFLSHTITPLAIAGTTGHAYWKDITYQDASGGFSDPTIDGRTVSVATYDDFDALWAHEDIAEGYGVLYGDDAVETLSKIEEVYGHRHDRHGDATTAGAGYGMRGCFVYNKSETSAYGGRNLFFPLGTSGYGHRKQSESWKTAVLRYASGRTAPLTTADYVADRPLFYDLYLRPGAIYWLKEEKTSGGREAKIIGWDINYFTFDFNYVGTGNVLKDTGSDACFVRCVEKD